MAASTFIDACLSGEVDLDAIDDFVQQWHESASRLSLSKYLGMTDDEYAIWVEDSETLPLILCARRADISLDEALEDHSGARLTAVARDKSEAAQVLGWLRRARRV